MEVIGLDHVYLTVSDLARSEAFYDRVLERLGFRKGDKPIAGEPHAHYFNRVLQITIRPARSAAAHDPYAPGLHHLCLQLPGPEAVDAAAAALRELGVEASEPAHFPEYNPDYYATFFRDPDGIRLELVGRTPYRDAIARHWDEFRVFLNPLADLRSDSPSSGRILLAGLQLAESPRWHDGRLWLSDWSAHEVIAVDLAGRREVVVRVESFPFCIDWLPDGRLLVVSGGDGRLLRLERDGSLALHADLSRISPHPWNEIVVDGRGHVYVNNTGFDFPGGEFAPGLVALVTADGSVRPVADGVAFPNGMAVTPDDRTLILAESYGNRLTAFDIAGDGSLSNRRVWADLPGGFPDGICLDADGAVWYADVPNQRCVRVREGGEVLQSIELDRGGFACMLGGADGRTLFVAANEWRGTEGMGDGGRTGQVQVYEAPSPHAGRP